MDTARSAPADIGSTGMRWLKKAGFPEPIKTTYEYADTSQETFIAC